MAHSIISPNELAQLIKDDQCVLVDIRERDEHAREAIKGAKNMPMSEIAACDCPEDGKLIVAYCRSGRRTEMAAPQLAEWAGREFRILEGGIDAWREAGHATNFDKKAPLELNRQVQITAGVLILLGALGSVFIHPSMVWISAFVGAGLTFAGVSGTCGMASMLMLMPWNRPATA